MRGIDPKLIWQVEQLSREHREQNMGGLWAVLAAPVGERREVGFVYDEADQRRLAKATDAAIRGVFTAAITNMRRDGDAIAAVQLQAIVALYKLPEAADWQTVLIERGAIVNGWWSDGIEAAMAASRHGMDALGFLSLALPELLADLVHGPDRGTWV
jgi:hypothetical protein